jgi:hypothetical protein
MIKNSVYFKISDFYEIFLVNLVCASNNSLKAGAKNQLCQFFIHFYVKKLRFFGSMRNFFFIEYRI